MVKKHTQSKTEASFVEATKGVCKEREKKELSSATKQSGPRTHSLNRRAVERLKDEIAAYKRLPEVEYQPVPATLHFSGMVQPLYDMIFDELAHGHALEDISAKLGDISIYCIKIAARNGKFRLHGQFGPVNRTQRIFLERDMREYLDVDTVCRNWGMTVQTVNKYANEFGIKMAPSSGSRKAQEQRLRDKRKDSSDIIKRPQRGTPYTSVKTRREIEAQAQASLWAHVREIHAKPILTSKNNDVTAKIDDKNPKKDAKPYAHPKREKPSAPASSKPEVAPEPC